jgi:hypothetical protein
VLVLVSDILDGKGILCYLITDPYLTGVPTSNETYRRCNHICKGSLIILYVSVELSRTACSRIIRFAVYI